MTDANTAYWSEAWAQAQRAYLRAVQNLPGSGGATTLDGWWQTVAPSAPPSARDFYSRLIELGKSYFEVTEALQQAFAGGGAGTGASAQTAFDRVLSDFQKAFGQDVEGDAGKHWQRLLGAWELPLATWQRTVASTSPGLGAAAAGEPRAALAELLGSPGVGHAREAWAQQQKLLRLALDYQRALEEYTQLFARTGAAAIQRLQQTLVGMAERGESVTSTRALYDLWVDCCEDVYADTVSAPEYAELYGRLVNSLMALKHQQRIITDDMLGALNMPTREELDTLHRRLQQARRRAATAEAELERLRGEGAALAERVRSLEASRSGAEGGAAPVAGRKPRRRKTKAKSRGADKD